MPGDGDREGRRGVLRRVAILRRECQNLRGRGGRGRGGLSDSVARMVLSAELEIEPLQPDTASNVLGPPGGGVGFLLGPTVLALGRPPPSCTSATYPSRSPVDGMDDA